MSSNVVVVIGCGGIGLAVARNLGSGQRLLLADYSEEILSSAENALVAEGYFVEKMSMDVSNFASVEEVAQKAKAMGRIDVIVHTAGVAIDGHTARRIYEINLVGTANVIEAFLPVAESGCSLVCIASMAGHMCPPMAPEFERHLATASRDELLNHDALRVDDTAPHSSAYAYGTSKRGNLLRVQAAASSWGLKGARVNSVSPGIISTELGRKEIAGRAGKFVASSPAARAGTPQDIVNAVAFLASPTSNFITGNDILVDGGATSSVRWNRPAATEVSG